MTDLMVTGNHDYRSDSLGGVDDLTFAAPEDATATFNAGQLSSLLSVHGSTNPDFVDVWVTSAGTFSAAGWSLDGWPDDGNHQVYVFGTKGDDQITGSVGADDIWGGAGADHLFGGPATDVFRYRFAYEIVPGETIDGGTGINRIVIEGGGVYDFTGANITHVGQLGFLAYDGVFATAVFRGDQFGTGRIHHVNTGPYATPTMMVKGAAVDLSTVTFGLGGSDINPIEIVGTAGADALASSEIWDHVTGGAGDDRMRGLGGRDTLAGGPGNDILSGGGDRDTFLFNTALSAASNVDHIKDFTHLVDRIMLKHSIFTALPVGAITPADFHPGTSAADTSDRIIYDQPSGRLWYDADGTGTRAPVLFAVLDNHTVLTAVDFLVA
jgi:Ca2+-binding RTX toxin-like protein